MTSVCTDVGNRKFEFVAIDSIPCPAIINLRSETFIQSTEMFHHCYGQPKRLDSNTVLTTRFMPTCFLLTEKNRFCSEWLQHECTRSLQQHSTVRKITV